jgi:hypothetical protein
MAAIWSEAAFSPSFISEPLPNFFSICSFVTSRIFSFSRSIPHSLQSGAGSLPEGDSTLHEHLFDVNANGSPRVHAHHLSVWSKATSTVRNRPRESMCLRRA